jgi:hypothetical protein
MEMESKKCKLCDKPRYANQSWCIGHLKERQQKKAEAKKLIKKIKQKTESQIKELLRKKCVKMAKDIAKLKVGYKCEYDGCEKSKENGYQMHGSHIYGENSNKSMSADPDNLLCLCASHHVGGMWKNSTDVSWHESPMEMTEWFRQKFPERAEGLKQRANKTVNCDLIFWKNKLESLKEQIKQYEQD